MLVGEINLVILTRNRQLLTAGSFLFCYALLQLAGVLGDIEFSTRLCDLADEVPTDCAETGD